MRTGPLLLLILALAHERRGVRGRLAALPGALGERALDVVNPQSVLDHIDLDRLLERVDVDRLLERVDVDALLARVDVDRLLARVDIDALLARVDVHALLADVDVDALLADVDVDALLARVDLEELVGRAGLPELIADSTSQVAGSALDLLRRQLVGLDVAVIRLAQHVRRRRVADLPSGPPLLVEDPTWQVAPPDLTRSVTRARMEVSGYYAGFVSRAVSFVGDVLAATFAYTLTTAMLSWLAGLVFGPGVLTADTHGPWWLAGLLVWYVLLWWGTTAVAGRTPVMGLVGLRIVARDGTPIRAGAALARTLTIPLSILVAGAGLLGVLFDPERRALHDRVARSTVVYDWGGRPAQLPSPISRWINEHDPGHPDEPDEAGHPELGPHRPVGGATAQGPAR